MHLLKSPLFYLPLLVLLAVNSSALDLGLWQRISVGGAVGAVGLLVHFRANNNGFSVIELLVLGLVIWPITGLGQVHAPSELYGHIARMSLLFGITLLARQAFKQNEEGALEAVAVGSQIALIIAGISLLPALAEAYRENDIYLATGSLFTHKNYAAATLLILLPLALSNSLKADYGKWIQRIAVALGLIGIVFLRTRGVWLAASVMVAVAVLHYFLQGEKTRRNQSLIAAGILAVGIAFAVIMGGAERIFNSSTIQTRMHYWNASWEMFLDNPITGVGAGQWKIAYPGTGLKGTNESVMNGTTAILRPHNDVLWLLSETGIGVAFFIAAMVLAFLATFKQGRNLFMCLTVVAFVVYGFGEFPLERATLLIPLAIALGYAAAGASDVMKLPKGTNSVIALVLLGLTMTVGASRTASEKDAKKALDGYLSRNPRQLRQHSEHAMTTFFEMDIYNNPMAYFNGLGILIGGGQQPSKALLGQSAEQFERALDCHPNHMLSMNQLAQIKRMQGDLTASAALYGRVLEISPRNTTAALKLAEVERVRGNIYASLDALKKIDPKYTPKTLPGLGREVTKTLVEFAKIENPRPASRSLHAQVRSVPASRMWSVWSTRNASSGL